MWRSREGSFLTLLFNCQTTRPNTFQARPPPLHSRARWAPLLRVIWISLEIPILLFLPPSFVCCSLLAHKFWFFQKITCEAGIRGSGVAGEALAVAPNNGGGTGGDGRTSDGGVGSGGGGSGGVSGGREGGSGKKKRKRWNGDNLNPLHALFRFYFNTTFEPAEHSKLSFSSLFSLFKQNCLEGKEEIAEKTLFNWLVGKYKRLGKDEFEKGRTSSSSSGRKSSHKHLPPKWLPLWLHLQPRNLLLQKSFPPSTCTVQAKTRTS